MGGKGSGSSSFCVNGGSIKLETVTGRFVRMKTVCKTWRCLGCRNRMISLFKARVQIGCSRLGQCAFITLTYKAGVESQRPVGYVRKDWAALWRRLRLGNSPLMGKKWLKVIELTKRGTPHHHLILGPIGSNETPMCMKRYDSVRYKRRFGNCDCLAHEFARNWVAVTGDSYIVHGREVVGAAGAASYMAKYLVKTFTRPDREDQLQMVRRWSSSRGWPGNADLHLRQTDEGGWEKRMFQPGKIDERFLGGPEDLMERNGENIVAELHEKRNLRRQVMEMERMAGGNDKNVRT